jgi:hypothetical protein
MEDLRGIEYGHIQKVVHKRQPKWNIMAGTWLMRNLVSDIKGGA